MKRLILAVVLSLSFSLPAFADTDRYADVGNKIQCTCGCGQILIKCNHVGCQSSDVMIRQLRAALNNFSNDEDVLDAFRKAYGMTAVVIPGTHGFELTIWVVPPLLVMLAFAMVSFLIYRWREKAVPVGTMHLDPKLEDLKSRARRETEL